MLKKILVSLGCTGIGFSFLIIFEGLIYLFSSIEYISHSLDPKTFENFIFAGLLYARVEAIVVFIWWIFFFLPFLFLEHARFFKKPFAWFWGAVCGSIGWLAIAGKYLSLFYAFNWYGILGTISSCIPAALVGAVSFYFYSKYLEKLKSIN